MFTASAVYHLVNAGPRLVLFLRKLDHSAIYLVIAGTYTPICLHYMTGFWQIGMLIIIWSLALAGIGVKLFVINAPRWVTAGVYLVMGWLSLAAVGEILASVPLGAIFWLVTGGLFFTVGAVIYVLKKPNFFPGLFGYHEVWHIFVILGALSHFVIMAAFVV
jgi:hemolysin III